MCLVAIGSSRGFSFLTDGSCVATTRLPIVGSCVARIGNLMILFMLGFSIDVGMELTMEVEMREGLRRSSNKLD